MREKCDALLKTKEIKIGSKESVRIILSPKICSEGRFLVENTNKVYNRHFLILG